MTTRAGTTTIEREEDLLPAPSNFHDKLLAAQKECHALNLTPEGEGQVGTRSYKYLTIGKLHAAVLPIMHEAGLTWTTCPTTIGDGINALNYKLSDSETDETGVGIDDTLPLVGCTDMQKLGSAITYARRYCLLAVLGLTPDEDDDGAVASKGTERAAAPTIPLDRARKILEVAKKAGLYDKTPTAVLTAKLTTLGQSKISLLTVDQAEDLESWLAEEASNV